MRHRQLSVRLLLRLFPRPFRDAHGEDLSELYAQLGIPFVRILSDLGKNALLVRWDEMRFAGRASRSITRVSKQGVRRSHGGSPMESVWLDLRFALRSLKKRPAVTAMILATLFLGIGSATTLFTAVDRVLLRPLPFLEPDRLVRVWWRPDSFNQRIVAFFRDEARSFTGLAAYSGWAFTLLGEGEPEELQGAVVSTNYFDVLGVEPAIGRGFRSEESDPGRSDVVVLGHGLWMRRFGGDPSVLGRRIQIAGASRDGATVIGVMPRSHVAVDPAVSWQAWLPLERPETLEDDNSWYLRVIGRLTSGISLVEASAETSRIARVVRETMYPRVSEEDLSVARVRRLDHVLVGADTRSYLVLLVGAVGVVLLVVCANVASLLLTRHREREREIALRSAFGAGRGRVVRQLVTESLVLGLSGGLLGTIAAALAVALIAPRIAVELPHAADMRLDLRVLAFAIVTSCLSAVLFGTLPALRASRVAIARGLAPGLRTSSPRRQSLKRLLVVFEVASALVFLSGAGLMVTSLVRLTRVDPGFDAERALIVGVNAPETVFPEPSATRRLYRELVPRLEAIPGVTAAGAIHLLPMSTGNWNFPYVPEGRSIGENDTPPNANFRVVTPGYFRAMGIPLRSGRDFTASDRDDAPPVGLVNEKMAGALFPGEDPVGRRVRIFSSTGPEFEVVGVVGDVRQHGLDAEPRPEIYRPLEQWTLGRNLIVLRTEGDPEALASAARAAVHEVEPALPIVQLGTLSDFVVSSVSTSRVVTFVLVSFAVLALSLAVVGVYGVSTATVSTRVREIGIRMALGASGTKVRRDTLGQEMIPIAAGMGLGIFAARFVERAMIGHIENVTSAGPGLDALASLFIGVVGLVACWVPARRASRVEPTTALRFE